MFVDWSSQVPQTSVIKQYYCELLENISAILGGAGADSLEPLCDKCVIDEVEKFDIAKEDHDVLRAVKLLSIMSKPQKSLKQFKRMLKWLTKGRKGCQLPMTISRQFGEYSRVRIYTSLNSLVHCLFIFFVACFIV